MKRTINTNIKIGFGISFLLLILSSVASYICITKLLENSAKVKQTQSILSNIDYTLSSVKDSENNLRGYLLTKDESFFNAYTEALKSVDTNMTILEKMVTKNPEQVSNCKQLQKALLTKKSFMIQLAQGKAEGDLKSNLKLGKRYTDICNAIVSNMTIVENRLLRKGTSKVEEFASYVPFFILLTSLCALAISILFYNRIRNQYKNTVKLENELTQKDREITHRISIIQNIAEKIADGDYTIRLVNEETDKLGNLATVLNKMATELETAFNLLNNKELLQTCLAKLNENLVGEKAMEVLTADIISKICMLSNSQMGAIYLLENKQLTFYNGYAHHPEIQKNIEIGASNVDQVARSGESVLLTDLQEKSTTISSISGEIKPENIFAYPILYEKNVLGVIEVTSLKAYTETELNILKDSATNIGNAIMAAKNRAVLQNLLEVTQAQAEELKAQQSKVESINTELEMQAQKLQASEEELRLQQEELMQSNQELEERSKSLEEKNQTILERNDQIEKKAVELAQSTKYKSEFLANMSHELRTPLNSVLLLSRMLADNEQGNLEEDQVESAQVINKSGIGLLNLIDEILDLSKIEAGKMVLDISTFKVSEICNDLRLLFKPVAKVKDLELIVIVPQTADIFINSDKMRLDQILKNLLSNALKFTTVGKVSLEVVLPEADDKTIKFIVKDTGTGIHESKQKLIFDAFQQADGTTSRKYGGTGLGLSISKELAKLLGGKIELVSEHNVGSTFSLIIPITAPTENQLLSKEAPDMSSYHSEKSLIKENPFTNLIIPEAIPDDRDNLNEGDKLILIIEDDTLFAKSLLNYTHQKGYKGIVAVSGDYGIQMANDYKPLAILLDIQLPIIDGWQILEDLKANPKTRHIPVHMMSSLKMKREILSKGAINFIDKPIAVEQMGDIFNSIQKALEKSPKKVLILEDNPKHALALSSYLENYTISAHIKGNVTESIDALKEGEIDCVILDMGIPGQEDYQNLEIIKNTPGLENLPIIVFTGRDLSRLEESKIKEYEEHVILKNAPSYQRVLSEVAIFLHVVEENKMELERKASKSKIKPLINSLTNKTILIADDDVRNIFSLTKALEAVKMNVVTATNGKEVFAKLLAHRNIDIVLLDMMMPEQDGYDTLKEIRQDAKCKNLPIIAITAKAMVGDREACIKAGASDYISKPLDFDQLLSLMRVWLYQIQV